MEQDILTIIKDGSLAPSGENCQPWKFQVAGSKVSIFNVPEADQSLYNFAQKGSYVAHGALIENIVISAGKHGYNASVSLFPNKNEPNLVSVISFEKGVPQNEPLYPQLAKRCTNRKDHAARKLSAQQKSDLIVAVKQGGFGELRIADDQPSLDALGQALAVNERLVFENKQLHDFFYGHVLWNEEDQKKAGGFYIKTLEFLPHQLKGVRLFKNWTALRIMNKVAGASKMIVKENAEKYSKSGALAIIVAQGDRNEDFVNAGRAAERAWLKATEMGLSVHPCTGVLYFMERIKGGDSVAFSPVHLEAIKKAYADIARVFGTDGKTIPMLFRIGYADAPTARALRMSPEVSRV